MDVYVKPIDVFLPVLKVWAVRYVGWYVPFSRPRNCGHRHESEELAQKCAQALLFRVRKDGHWDGGRGPSRADHRKGKELNVLGSGNQDRDGRPGEAEG